MSEQACSHLCSETKSPEWQGVNPRTHQATFPSDEQEYLSRDINLGDDSENDLQGGEEVGRCEDIQSSLPSILDTISSQIGGWMTVFLRFGGHKTAHT